MGHSVGRFYSMGTKLLKDQKCAGVFFYFLSFSYTNISCGAVVKKFECGGFVYRIKLVSWMLGIRNGYPLLFSKFFPILK